MYYALIVVTWWSHGITQTVLPWKYQTLEQCKYASEVYENNGKSILGVGICVPAGTN